jgi:parallel beta-helix repeat protein
MIEHNGNDGEVYYGIRLYKPADNPYILNNTIAYNNNYGIYFEDTDNDYPEVINCIFWHNDVQLNWDYTTPSLTVTYSCIQDSNDIVPSAPYYNFNTDPNFAYIGINSCNLHLAFGSPCKNTGDSSGDYSDANDIDGDYRVFDDDYDIVDMGSDEVSCEDIVNKWDFNGDGLVNYFEFAIFSDAWLAYDPNEVIPPETDPAIHAAWAKAKRCDFDEDYDIDIVDLIYLANDWLWQGCWKKLDQGFAMMSMGGGMEMMSLETAAIPQPEPTVEEQIEQYEYLIDWLEILWKTDKSIRDAIDKDAFDGMIDSLEAWLNELEGQL